MKKLLFINHTGGLHGAETVLIELLSYISKHKEYIITVVWNKSDKERNFFNKVSELSIDTIIGFKFKLLGGSFFRNIFVFFYNLCACLKIINLIYKKKIDIICSNTSINSIGIICSILTKKTHFWHFHEPVSACFGLNKETAIIFRILLQYKKNKVIFISNNQKSEWENYLKIKISNYIIVYNPIKQIEINKKPIALSGNTVFGFIGTLNKRKNLNFLIKVFSQLLIKYQNIKMKLIITGNGPEKDRIDKEISKYDLKENVLLQNYTTNVSEFFSNIDICVVPSKSESWGLIALEALNAEKALIMTKNTGITEILDGDDCIFIDPLSENSLYQAMEKLLLDKNYRNTIAKNGKNKIIYYNFNNKFNLLFEQLINGKYE
jgi:glycosyltransferase involved in cell wall biosynthesis